MEASHYKSLTGANTLFACKVAGNFAPFKIRKNVDVQRKNNK